MRKLRWALLLFFIPFLAESQVQVSGYISLKWLGGLTYQATVVDYTQGNPENNGACGSAADIDTIRLSWGDGIHELIYRSNGKANPPDTVPSGDSVCECTKANVYLSTPHTFPGPNTYGITFDQGKRIPNIINMFTSVIYDMLIYDTITINPAVGYNFNTPPILNSPICSYGCPGQCYNFNLDADTAGGDSLSYSLGDCRTVNGIACPGYYIPTNASINPVTGLLSWCNPDSVGLYNFAIRITTYKKIIVSGKPVRVPINIEEAELQVNIQDSCVLGINEITNKNAYYIYPNPTGNVVYINGGNETNKLITVYDLLGQPVISTEEKQEQFALNTSGLSSGLYFVNIKEEQTGRSYTLKLVKN